jgi:beta-lactamase class C
MKAMKVSLLVSVFVLALMAPGQTRLADTPGSGSARPTPKKPGALTDQSINAKNIELLAQRLVQEKNLPGLAVAIVQDGQVLSAKGYGVTDNRQGSAVMPYTVFRLASLSKGFAGTLSGQLVDEGAMSWDSPIINQLPAFKLNDFASGSTVTVRDVLSHRVGLRDHAFDSSLAGDQPYALIAERLSEAPMTCSPGDCYGYQNIAFSLIGDMTFAATGDFYPSQVEKRIFLPLGMSNASYGLDGLMASASWAKPHVRSGGTWLPVTPNENYYRVPPAAGVNASIQDMAQWLRAQLGHRPDVLSKDVLNEIHTPQVATPGEIRASGWRSERLNNAYYGLGWRVMNYSGRTMIFHGGAVRGFRGVIAFLPDQDVGIVILWNSESAMPSGLMPTFFDAALGLPSRNWLGLEELGPVSDEAGVE